ncbi:hypothetical protein PGUG_05082 [Meyerozyma guilliermondii ATCC 6260]|uniref:SAC domain-containing protein n=1 Tax=Meyerozyma guilliermondii (strain ATCC 6260 / CBS 566 / DSM 6381 / JCM 1539 / NBRC 10279 / NRRL Y-324) TaxID=294746 RepID=A5DP81_PICGU|nr:uncharacterized protein PGUG_05082 [Meyerozyma guilliermondii ATCC 6260]EDK40984.2 hypothetical protein PGUG_05082 [Meyerozyma guilliermondii ATCC 6260]
MSPNVKDQDSEANNNSNAESGHGIKYEPPRDVNNGRSKSDTTSDIQENEENDKNNNETESQEVDDSDNVSSDESEHSTPDASNKRIILQRFTIYNSLTTMYIVGSNAKESLFRVLEINKDSKDEKKITAIEDKNFFYTRKDMVELINDLNETVEGGIHKVTRGYGIIGLIRFTRGYYLSIITKCSQVAILGGHFVYHIDETKLIPLDIHYARPIKYSDEERLLSIFKYLDLGKTFYFSYSYDITNSLQTNFMRYKDAGNAMRNTENASDNETKQRATDVIKHNDRFVWNKVLLKPLESQDITIYEWFQPIIHGFVDQANISIYGKKIYITIIARRSHHFAGARFLKRGVNDKGNVANEVETEQIVSDMMTTSFHDPKHGYYNNPRYTSFVQHRGSIPLYWSQDLNKLPKPPIEINLSDPFYQSSAIHFDNLFRRYGSPIIILNLIKTKEKHPRESKLNQHFNSCIRYLNQFLPEKNKLRYHSFDMSKHSKKNLDVIGPLQNIAADALKETGYFHNGATSEETKLQEGVIRTNCIDCLDRTNAAQFIICKEALSLQLASLGLIPKSTSLDYDSDLINILTEMFHDHGDTIAVQYGGSNLVNTMDSYRRINQWSSHTRDMLNSVKRIYSNSFMDSIRQEAINLFLGNYVYDPTQPKLWELQNDFYLHNEYQAQDIRKRRSYIHWYNDRYFDRPIFVSNRSLLENKIPSPAFEYNPEQNDNWFNESYVPRKYQSMSDLFQFNMNSNARYFPSISSNEFDYSPFKSRKPYPKGSKADLIGSTGGKSDGNEHVKYLDTCDTETLVPSSASRPALESTHSSSDSNKRGKTNKNFLQHYALKHLITSKGDYSKYEGSSSTRGSNTDHARHKYESEQRSKSFLRNLEYQENSYYVAYNNVSYYQAHVNNNNFRSSITKGDEGTDLQPSRANLESYKHTMKFSTCPTLSSTSEFSSLENYFTQMPCIESRPAIPTKEVAIRDDYFG